jgi:hypothetical protein
VRVFGFRLLKVLSRDARIHKGKVTNPQVAMLKSLMSEKQINKLPLAAVIKS